MARLPTIYCNKNPYHISARCNNQDWFDIPMDYCYGIYINILRICIKRYKVKIHAFVLMNNHFHLLMTTPEKNIGEVMRYFMTETARGIRKKSDRINHVYGGRHHKTLIVEAEYYAHCLKYVLRNPVKANICDTVENYRWSSISEINKKIKPLISPLEESHNKFLPKCKNELSVWLNRPTPKEIDELCRQALKKTRFKFSNRKKIGSLGLP